MMAAITHFLRFLPVILVLGYGVPVWSSSLPEAVERLLQTNQPPEGVVIELLSWDEKTWTWAAPRIAEIRQQLKNKFAEIDIAVVSHGGEQFQLTRQRESEQPQAIAQLRELTDQGVNLHVCGTHSYWKDVPEADYLDIVDVSPSGPAQINDYIKLGYTLVKLEAPQ